MIFRVAKTTGAIASAMILVACGGGGSDGGGGGGSQASQDQVITFTTPGTVSGEVGGTVTNVASGGGGTGTVTYSSNNLSVATVNPTSGVATLLAVGSTTITAIKAASSGFNQASASYTLNVTAGAQSISFAQAGPLQALVGAVVNNTASGGAGAGAITYATSDSAVATVNSTTGAVTAVAQGSAIITATKAADANYQQAQATYTINVIDSVAMSAWVGATNSQVTLAAAANGTRFIRSSDRNCNLAAFSVCSNVQSTIVANSPSTPISDLVATTNTPGYYWLQTDTANSRPAAVNVNRFSERIGHGALFFNNRYWVIGGGVDIPTTRMSDVWSSADGKTWELETATGAFGQRWFHQSVVFDNKMWVIGGYAPSAMNDVWYSTDGVTWTFVPQTAPLPLGVMERLRVVVFNNAMWAVVAGSAYSSTDGANWQLRANGTVAGGIARHLASLTVYAGKLWYIGGSTLPFQLNVSGNTMSDVWSSSDGIAWTQETPDGGFGSRFRHAAFVLNNRLWVFGGQAAASGVLSPRASAWSTADGITWTQEALNTEADRSTYQGVVQEPTKVTLIAGIQRLYSDGVYQSTDGNNWIELSPYAQFSARIGARAVSFDGYLWLIGGVTFESGATNEVWRSSDGLNWTRVNPVGTTFPRRVSHRVLAHNGRLWVIGGNEDASSGGSGASLNDVWSSADGITWRNDTANAPFSARLGHAAAVFNGRMWVIGGNDGVGSTASYRNDVWSSSDGENWTLEATNADFSERSLHTVIAFNNALWLLAGDNGASLGDVWTSANGVNWTLVPPNGTTFVARANPEAVVHNGRMWLTGGSNGPYPTPTNTVRPWFNDVWSSADGVNWISHSPANHFAPRILFGMAVHNGEMWVISGWNLDRYNDVWRSSDGVNWRVGISDTIRMP